MNSTGLFGLIIVIAVFFFCRDLMCWYFKINVRLAKQEEMVSLLKSINEGLKSGVTREDLKKEAKLDNAYNSLMRAIEEKEEF
jgi:hypothetical protein